MNELRGVWSKNKGLTLIGDYELGRNRGLEEENM